MLYIEVIENAKEVIVKYEEFAESDVMCLLYPERLLS